MINAVLMLLAILKIKLLIFHICCTIYVAVVYYNKDILILS